MDNNNIIAGRTAIIFPDYTDINGEFSGSYSILIKKQH